MWFWRNNGPRPPDDPEFIFKLMIVLCVLYIITFGGTAIVSQFIDAIYEWVVPTGRFGHLRW